MKKILAYVWLFLCLISLCYRPYVKTTYKKEGKNNIYLTIENTSFLEQVMQYSDNTYYLTHDKAGNKNALGAIFFDYRTKMEDVVAIIYGHNSETYDVPFRLLNAYTEEEYFRTHTILTLEKEGSIYTYKLFSCFVAYEDFFYMQLPSTEQELLLYINKLKENSWYKDSYIPKKEDHILILQTCSYHKKYRHYKEKYLILAAYLINSSDL